MAHSHGKAVHRVLHLTSPAPKGADVHALQEAIDRELRHRKFVWRTTKADGQYGNQTRRAAHFLAWLIGLSGARLNAIEHGRITKDVQRLLRDPSKRGRLDRLRERVRKAKAQQIRHTHDTGSAAAVAYIERMAAKGIHEVGESNTGRLVDQWEGHFGIHAEPWCGCLAGYAAQVIGGSTATTWFPYGPSIMADAQAGRNGVHAVSFDDIEPGDILVLWGGDHVVTAAGKPNGDSIRTVEGNTSPNDGDSQADGGCVAMKTRSRSDVSCVARPY